MTVGFSSIINNNIDSAAGKILRRELREQARKELEERDPVNTITLSKL